LFPYSSYAPLYYAQAEGYYAEQGLDVEFVNFSKQSDVIAALAARQIDVSGGALDVATFAAIGTGAGIKIVADKGYVKPDATCPYGAWMVRNDLIDSGKLDNLSNIKGMKVVFSKAGFFEFAMDKLLAPTGLSVDDLDIIEMPVPARLEAFKTGAIDIAQVGEPWITRTLATGSAKIWQPFETYLPNAQYAVIWFGPTITKGNQDIGDRFMVAYLKAVRQYNQGKTEHNVALMADFTKSTSEVAAASCWQAFSSDSSVNLNFIHDFQQWAVEKGYLDRIIETNEYWDGSYLEYAYKQLP
jgi:NitT/TauT family transport system substrate-binding protein